MRTNGVVLRLLGAKLVRTNGVVLRLLGAKLETMRRRQQSQMALLPWLSLVREWTAKRSLKSFSKFGVTGHRIQFSHQERFSNWDAFLEGLVGFLTAHNL